jgi:hypothetical protein
MRTVGTYLTLSELRNFSAYRHFRIEPSGPTRKENCTTFTHVAALHFSRNEESLSMQLGQSNDDSQDITTIYTETYICIFLRHEQTVCYYEVQTKNFHPC